MKRSERKELLGIASNNLKLKPTTHGNEFTSRVKAHKAITTRVVTGPTKSLALHTVTCFFRFQSNNFTVFIFCDPGVSLVTRNGSFSRKSFIVLFVFVGTLTLQVGPAKKSSQNVILKLLGMLAISQFKARFKARKHL